MNRSKWMITAIAAIAVATPAAANHLFNLNVPFANRGACESAVAELSAEDRDQLLDRFPNLFQTNGEVASFLTRAFPCERGNDGQWYIEDHRLEVLQSEWFLRR